MIQRPREHADHRAASRIAARYRSRSDPPAASRSLRAPVREADDAIEQSLGALEVVRGHHDDGAGARRAWRRSIKSDVDWSSRPVNGSSSSTSRGSWSSARSSASRWRSPRENPAARSFARAVRRAAASAFATRAAGSAMPYKPGEERQVLGGREIAVEKQIVAEHADPGSQRVANLAREFAAVPDLAGAWPGERRQNSEQRGLPCPVRPEEADDLTGPRRTA